MSFTSQSTNISTPDGETPETALRRKADRGDLPSDLKSSTGTRTSAATDAYLESKTIHPDYAGDTTLLAGLTRAKEAGMPEIAVSPMQGQFLAVLAKGMRAEKILEIGTLGGYSTSFLAKSLPSHGRIDTIEYSPLHAEIANRNFIETDLYPFPKIHVGDAVSLLTDPRGPFAIPPGTEEGLAEGERGYDLVFIDADKQNCHTYFQEGLRLARKGGVIVVDNAVRGGRIALQENDNPDINVEGLRKMYDWIEQDGGKTVLGSGIQTVGAKSWDGFFIATKL